MKTKKTLLWFGAVAVLIIPGGLPILVGIHFAKKYKEKKGLNKNDIARPKI